MSKKLEATLKHETFNYLYLKIISHLCHIFSNVTLSSLSSLTRCLVHVIVVTFYYCTGKRTVKVSFLVQF